MDEFTGQESGPFTFAEIQQMIQKHKLKKKDFVRRADSAQWVKAGEMLVKVFENIDAFEEQQKEQLKKKRAEEKLRRASEKQLNKRQQAVKHNQKVAENRGTIWQKIFGEDKPSPYWGFDVQRAVIKLMIGLTMIIGVAGVALSLGAGIYNLFDAQTITVAGVTSGRSLWDRMLMFGLSVLSSAGVVVTAFLVVAQLVFFRNFIDWLIDTEAHANAIHKHFGTRG
jgi:hypothetical protein